MLAIARRPGGDDRSLRPLRGTFKSAWNKAKPVYETLPGWKSDTTKVTRYEDLPANAKAYLTRFSELCGAPVAFVGVGPDRVQTLIA